ncbi:ComA operon protein 2 [Minicystis rosea]|nr:ComA operon protein 2 [Minicystis rosea]
MTEPNGEDLAEMLNGAAIDGWARANGLRFLRASREEVVAELTIGPQHRQPYGIVHGGVHAGIIETLASVGAAIHAMPQGKNVVGMENHTSFLRAVRAGKLTATGKPVFPGKRSHIWEVTVHDETGRAAATGRVRLLLLDPDDQVGGERVTMGGPDQA